MENLLRYKSENINLTLFVINEYQVLCRPLSLKEYSFFAGILAGGYYSANSVHRLIFHLCLVDKDFLNFIHIVPAGIPLSVGRALFYKSGIAFNEQTDNVERFNALLQNARNKIHNHVYDTLICYICKAFPSYKPLELEELPFAEFLRLVAMAERILDIQPFVLLPEVDKPNLVDKLLADAKQGNKVDEIPIYKRDFIENQAQAREDFLKKIVQPDGRISEKHSRQLETLRRAKELKERSSQ